MSDTAQTTTGGDARIAALIGYGLFILAVVNGLTAVAGVVLAYIKRGDVRGTVWESHFTNMIRVFWASAVAIALFIAAVVFGAVDVLARMDSAPGPLVLTLVPLLFLAGLAFAVWYFYRMIRGFVRALDGKPY